MKFCGVIAFVPGFEVFFDGIADLRESWILWWVFWGYRIVG